MFVPIAVWLHYINIYWNDLQLRITMDNSIYISRACVFFFSFSSIAFVSLCNLMRAILDHPMCKWTVTIYGKRSLLLPIGLARSENFSITLSNWPIAFSLFIDSAVGSTWSTSDHQYQFLLCLSHFKIQAIRHNLTKRKRVHYFEEHKKHRT